ncbi:MAG: hypothetical protein ABIQ16_14305 [Polyangiaceae bacterium]
MRCRALNVSLLTSKACSGYAREVAGAESVVAGPLRASITPWGDVDQALPPRAIPKSANSIPLSPDTSAACGVTSRGTILTGTTRYRHHALRRRAASVHRDRH